MFLIFQSLVFSFGITLKARKLGVVVSVNMRAQNQGVLPGIFEEIFKEFPDSPVFLTNGGGMRDWEVVEKEYKKRVDENNQKKKAGQPHEKFLAKELKRPEAARFNTGAALDWVVVQGFEPNPDYVGLKAKHPDLFDDLRRRSGVWFIDSNKEADGAYLAFEELMKKGVEAIYWYNQFDRPIEGEETWGLIVNEAMACGTPAIVSTACGCTPDLIVQGETGYSFKLGDVQGLAECLRRFVARRNEAWSERVRAKISQYTIEKATEGLARAMAAQPLV